MKISLSAFTIFSHPSTKALGVEPNGKWFLFPRGLKRLSGITYEVSNSYCLTTMMMLLAALVHEADI